MYRAIAIKNPTMEKNRYPSRVDANSGGKNVTPLKCFGIAAAEIHPAN
jgi:hypothetical protein